MDLQNTEHSVTSKKYSLNIKDVLRSFLVAIVTPILVEVQRIADSGVFVINYKQMAMIAIGACAAYLIKNYFTPASIKIPIKDSEINPNDSTTSK